MTVDGNKAFEVFKGLAKGLREAQVRANTWENLISIYYVAEVFKKKEEAKIEMLNTQQLYDAFCDCCTLQPDEASFIKTIFNEPYVYIIKDVINEYAEIIEGL